MELLIGSKNLHKISEIKAIFDSFGIYTIGLSEEIEMDDVPELEDDFMGNAELKALTLAKRFQKPTLADDSGLVVKSLYGLPGIFSHRYSGLGDEINNRKLLLSLEHHEKRDAYYVCALALAFPDGKVFRFLAHFRGEIARAPKGQNGFGYDPIFYVKELNQTVAELDPIIKNTISHRAKALNQLKEYCDEIINYWRYSWQK
jgi:XTP/dITP diphosphohydrolase